uniref:SH2 domain-containing protein n=1 Tax=Steinernema glaseri TaxID=37863 RepID=A0A1I7ZMA1_9BILA
MIIQCLGLLITMLIEALYGAKKGIYTVAVKDPLHVVQRRHTVALIANGRRRCRINSSYANWCTFVTTAPTSEEYVGKLAPPVPQIRTTAPERRRNSYLLRTPAFDNHVLPMKQISAPLPEQQKIYDRGHAHSRSWNPEEECYDASFDYPSEVREHEATLPPARRYATPAPAASAVGNDPYKRFYEEMVRLFGENLPVELKRLTLDAVNQPHPQSMDSLGVRHHHHQQQQFTRQVKSFDDRSAGPKQRSPKYSGMGEKRSQSESERKQLLRQSTIDMLQSEMNEVSLECQNLWDTRQSLEQNPHLAYQLSTDFSENSASTSFESNTESMQHDSSGGRKGSAGMLLEAHSGSGHSADSKRQKYKNLLLHRQLVSNSVYPEPVANFESVCTTGSDSSFMEPANHGASSFDSSRSEMTFGGDLAAELAFKSLANLDGRPMASVKPQMTQVRQPLVNANKNHARVATGRTTASLDLRRDYSVDSKTDSIFREFSRIDPKYEEPSASGAGRMLPAVGQRPVTDKRECRQSLGRFRSMDGRPLQIPTIRYSDDQNRH